MDNKIKGIPSHEEYMAYVEQQGWNDWTDELWEELERTKRLTNRGTACSNWHIIANARNGVIMKCLSVTNTKKSISQKMLLSIRLQKNSPVLRCITYVIQMVIVTN